MTNGGKRVDQRALELRYQFRFRVLDVTSKALDQIIPGFIGGSVLI